MTALGHKRVQATGSFETAPAGRMQSADALKPSPLRGQRARAVAAQPEAGAALAANRGSLTRGARGIAQLQRARDNTHRPAAKGSARQAKA